MNCAVSSEWMCIFFNVLFYFNIVVCMTSTTEENEILRDEDHPCYRPCVRGQRPMKCHYTFTVEMYSTLSLACFACPVNISDCYRPDCIAADGTAKSVFVVNRRLPGTGIHVCRDDTVIVDVENEAPPQTTSIHWHGILQHNTKFMDGVPGITQCPIQPYTTFRYTFPVPDAGTYLWHSHSALQKVDGLFGPLVIREPYESQIYAYDYDLPEHVIMVNDWYIQAIKEEFARIELIHLYTHPRSILVNGRGRYRNLTDTAKQIFEPPADEFSLDGRGIIQRLTEEETEVFHTPIEIFYVEYGKRYRFRLIGSGVQCAIQVSIEAHQLEIIGTDARPVEPTIVDAVNVVTGERYDFVVTANNEIDNYWVKFRGLEDCDNRTVSAFQVAILRYIGAPEEDPPGTPSYDFTRASGLILNPITTDNKTMVGSIVMLDSTLPDDQTSLRNPDVRYILQYDYRINNDTIYNRPEYFQENSGLPFHLSHPLPLFNYIYNTFPPSPLLSQFRSLPEDTFCNEESNQKNGRDCITDFCSCVHLIKAPLGAVVEVVLIDDGIFPAMNANHPIHFHGYSFRVVAMGRFEEGDGKNQTTEIARIRELASRNKLVQKLHRAVHKDTISVPNGGYAVIRFFTDNPGFWLLHCHNDVHMDVGLALTMQVGELYDFPKPPKGFPTCSHFMPKSKRSLN